MKGYFRSTIIANKERLKTKTGVQKRLQSKEGEMETSSHSSTRNATLLSYPKSPSGKGLSGQRCNTKTKYNFPKYNNLSLCHPPLTQLTGRLATGHKFIGPSSRHPSASSIRCTHLTKTTPNSPSGCSAKDDENLSWQDFSCGSTFAK